MTPEAAFGPATPAKKTAKVTGTVAITATAVDRADDRPDRHQHRAGHSQPRVRDQLVAAGPGEARQHQRREPSEGGERGHLQVADHHVGEREQTRHDDRRANRAHRRGGGPGRQ